MLAWSMMDILSGHCKGSPAAFCAAKAFFPLAASFLISCALPAMAEENGHLSFDGNVVVGEDDGGIAHAVVIPVIEDGVGSIDLGSGDTFMVAGDNYVQVTGDGSKLIRSGKGDVRVLVGGASDEDQAALDLGSAWDGGRSGGTIRGSVAVAAGNSLTINGGTVSVTSGITGAGDVSVEEDAHLSASLDMAEGSSLYVLGTVNAQALASSGDIDVYAGGRIDARQLAAKGRLGIAGEVEAASLTAAGSSVINVGSDGGPGYLSARETSLNGAAVFVYGGEPADPEEDRDDVEEEDPEDSFDEGEDDEGIDGGDDADADDDEEGWDGDDDAEDDADDGDDGSDDFWDDEAEADISLASKAIFSGTEINGRITAGRNSLVVLGDDSPDWAENAFWETGYAWGTDVSAAVAIVRSQRLSALGGLKVDGSLTPDDAEEMDLAEANKAEFADDSLLIVSAEAASGEGALVGDGSSELYVAPDAKLHLQDAAAGKTYTVTSGFKKQEILGWQGENLSTNSLIDARGEVSDGTFRIKTAALPAAEVLPGSMIPKTLDALIAGGSHSVLASSASILFLSRAVDSMYLPHGQEDRLNEVSRAAVTAGVQNTSLKVAHAAGESIEHHLSLGWHDREGVIHRDGLDAWVSPMYGNTYTSGLAIRGGAVRGNYGGVTAGLDGALGSLWGGDFRLGFAIHGGGGKAHVGGMVTDTHDSYNFGGFHLYSGWRLGGLNIMAQAGYAVSSHDMKMNLPASMRIGQVKADIGTHAVTAALRAEHAFHAGPVDIIPHAGVRWTALTTEQHSLKIRGEKVNTVRSDTQNVVQFPVGITLVKDIRIGGWDVKPRLDLNVTPAAGDKKAVTKVSYAGVDAWDSMRSRVMDSVTYGGLAGVQASKGNMSFGVDYGIQAGRHERDQRVRLSFSYKF